MKMSFATFKIIRKYKTLKQIRELTNNNKNNNTKYSKIHYSNNNYNKNYKLSIAHINN